MSSAATCFEPGNTLDPELIVRNKQLIRSRGYIADIDIAVLPDAFDSTRVNLAITTRDSWTISVDGGWYSESRTMVGFSDANIGWGNKLEPMTNFSRKDFFYGGNMVEYEIPNVLGSFYTAEFAAGRDFYNSTLDMGLRKEFIKPTDYEIGLTYSDIKSKRYMVEQDTSLLVKERNLDAWAAIPATCGGSVRASTSRDATTTAASAGGLWWDRISTRRCTIRTPCWSGRDSTAKNSTRPT
ncbi:MAG: hypothetical protein V8Q54_09655 [Alistipes senegalensis]